MGRPPAQHLTKVTNAGDFARIRAEVDVCDDDVIPERRAIPGIDQRGVSLEGALGHTRTATGIPRLQRLMREMKSVQCVSQYYSFAHLASVLRTKRCN
eukprot:COSAG06_NODE_701_length_12943_cov_458.708891_2_plen_98_part_00